MGRLEKQLLQQTGSETDTCRASSPIPTPPSFSLDRIVPEHFRNRAAICQKEKHM